MASSIDQIHHGTGKVGGKGTAEVAVEGKVDALGSGFRDSQRGAEDGVGAEVFFRGGAISCNEFLIEDGLSTDIFADEEGGNLRVDMSDSFEDALASIPFFVVVAQFECFMCAGRGA